MKVAIYTIGMKKLIGTYDAKEQFEDSFYHCNMPTLSARVCKEILEKVSKISSEYLILENMETGHVGAQNIYKNGTILNF